MQKTDFVENLWYVVRFLLLVLEDQLHLDIHIQESKYQCHPKNNGGILCGQGKDHITGSF